MIELINECLKQIDNIKIDDDTIIRLNDFFKSLNDQLKGSNDSLIECETTDSSIYIITNLYSDYNEIRHLNTFLLDFKDYIMAFSDDIELLYDIFYLMLDCGLIVLNQALRLLLFKKIYKSGYFNYVAIDSPSFKDNFNYSLCDLKIIGHIVSYDNINDIDSNLSIIADEIYLFDGLTLKDVIL